MVGSVGDDFPDPKRDVFVARFHPDGSLDGEFGSGGVVTTDLGALSGEVARDVVVQPDGRLVVAASGRFESGVLYPKRSTDLVVLRYTSAGTLDPDFASGGVLHVPSESDGAYFVPAGLVQGSDGTILVGGDIGLTHRDNNTGAIAQVRTDGSLDRVVRFSGQRTSSGMSFDARRGRIYHHELPVRLPRDPEAFAGPPGNDTATVPVPPTARSRRPRRSYPRMISRPLSPGRSGDERSVLPITRKPPADPARSMPATDRGTHPI